MKKLLLILVIATISLLFLKSNPESTLEIETVGVPEAVAHPAPPHSVVPKKIKNVAKAAPSAFEKKINAILETLPTNAQFQASTKDHTHTPQELIDASKPLAEVIDSMKQDPKLIAAGKSFFKKCALKDEVVDQIRALCLRDLRDWAESTNEGLPLGEFPHRLVKLSDFLAPTKY